MTPGDLFLIEFGFELLVDWGLNIEEGKDTSDIEENGSHSEKPSGADLFHGKDFRAVVTGLDKRGTRMLSYRIRTFFPPRMPSLWDPKRSSFPSLRNRSGSKV